jgi:hypothetical protein
MGYDMYYRDRADGNGEGYFRLNVWGMRWCRDEMAARGMLFDAGPYPAWPEGDYDLIDRLRFPEYYDDPLTPEKEREAKTLADAVDAVLSWHGPEIPGIPAHKFSSNDGWIVTPAECEATVRIAAEHAPVSEEHAERWRKWIAFMHRASKHGGFEVH